jgi:ferredoxin
MVTVRVDERECSGCGICYNDEASDIFAEGDNGISELLPAFQKGNKFDGQVPDDKKESAKRAALSCPNSAISIM